MIKVTGNTYPAKTMLKDSGFGWHNEQKAWFGDDSALTELKRISRPTYSRANSNAFVRLKIETI